MRKNIAYVMHQFALCTGRSYDRWGIGWFLRYCGASLTVESFVQDVYFARLCLDTPSPLSLPIASIQCFLRDRTAQLDTFLLKPTICSLSMLSITQRTRRPSSQILGLANLFPYCPSAQRMSVSLPVRDLERVDATRPHASLGNTDK